MRVQNKKVFNEPRILRIINLSLKMPELEQGSDWFKIRKRSDLTDIHI